MGTRNRCDVARQAANVVGTLFQVAVPVLTGPAIGQISEENRTLVVPAGYAFAIWTPIFLLCFAYAAYQALPANRENGLPRRIGPFTAGAFFFNGLWEVIFPARQGRRWGYPRLEPGRALAGRPAVGSALRLDDGGHLRRLLFGALRASRPRRGTGRSVRHRLLRRRARPAEG